MASPWRNKWLIESPFRPLLTDNPGLPYIECLMESRWPKRRKSAVSGRQWCELILITPINTRTVVAVNRYVYNSPGLTLGLCPANERRRYFLRPSQWEMALLFNNTANWLGVSMKSAQIVCSPNFWPLIFMWRVGTNYHHVHKLNWIRSLILCYQLRVSSIQYT